MFIHIFYWLFVLRWHGSSRSLLFKSSKVKLLVLELRRPSSGGFLAPQCCPRFPLSLSAFLSKIIRIFAAAFTSPPLPPSTHAASDPPMSPLIAVSSPCLPLPLPLPLGGTLSPPCRPPRPLQFGMDGSLCTLLPQGRRPLLAGGERGWVFIKVIFLSPLLLGVCILRAAPWLVPRHHLHSKWRRKHERGANEPSKRVRQELPPLYSSGVPRAAGNARECCRRGSSPVALGT